MTPAELNRLTETEARELLEKIRWQGELACPRCGSTTAVALGGKAGEKGQKKCRDCRKNFTVRTGTIFEDSPIKLRDWVYAFSRMCSSKKGISAAQIERELGVTYKTAWFMCHRIRHAMQGGSIQLSGVVEVDETFCGGKPRKQPGVSRKRWTKTKQPVQTLVERGGNKVSRVVPNVQADTLKANIRELVARDATIMTDEWRGYHGIGSEFAKHSIVTHSKDEYVGPNGECTNTAESSFALIKRGLYGTFHSVSKHHLQRYLDEFDYRWNTRMMNDAERTLKALAQADGKRLTYKATA